MGVPDLQSDDLTESQLAVLLFDRKCSVGLFFPCNAVLSYNLTIDAASSQFCGQQEGRATWPFDFALRVRCCPACQRQRCI